MHSERNFGNRSYWIVENAQYAEASFRLRKCALLINRLAANRECSLLDVGCGPASLQHLLSQNVTYYGVDIAIHKPAANLRETDLARETIAFDNKRFDFVVALGFFEYMGHLQKRKLEEIREIVKPDGKFIMSYINFGHYRRKVWQNYNNVQPIAEMKKGLQELFLLDRYFPASYHWRQKQPGKYALPALQMRMNLNIPIFSSLLAVEYFFICSRPGRAVPAFV